MLDRDFYGPNIVVRVDPETRDKMLDGVYKCLVLRGSHLNRLSKYMVDDMLDICSEDEAERFAVCSVDGCIEGDLDLCYSFFAERLGTKAEFMEHFRGESVLTVFSLYEFRAFYNEESDYYYYPPED